jgi:hypothetical protein
MASVQSASDMGASQLPGGMTREQAQHIYKVRTLSRFFAPAAIAPTPDAG